MEVHQAGAASITAWLVKAYPNLTTGFERAVMMATRVVASCPNELHMQIIERALAEPAYLTACLTSFELNAKTGLAHFVETQADRTIRERREQAIKDVKKLRGEVKSRTKSLARDTEALKKATRQLRFAEKRGLKYAPNHPVMEGVKS